MVVCCRYTCQCQRCRCTCWLMTSSTAVQSVTNRSHGRGCSRDTCAHILERNLSAAHTAGRRSPTGRTCALTCRLTRRSSCTRASVAASRSRSKPTSTSTTSRRVSATMAASCPEKTFHRQLAVMKTRDPAWPVSGAYENARSTDLPLQPLPSIPRSVLCLWQHTCKLHALQHPLIWQLGTSRQWRSHGGARGSNSLPQNAQNTFLTKHAPNFFIFLPKTLLGRLTATI